MASLYTNRDSNIRKTWIIFTVFLVVVIGIGYLFSRFYDNPTIVIVAAIIAILMSVFSYWNSDKVVLRMMHATPISREDNRDLYTIVENLSITAGLPVPRIFVTEEAQLNAFATGRDPEHAVIVVTRGLLQHLDKPELEGVISHELSHVGNRDILVSTIVVVLVGFIAVASDIFLRSLRFGGGRKKGGEIFIIFAIIGAILAPIAATLLQSAISRKRESLADTSGALLTRYPEGLANALEKIAADTVPMSHVTNSTAHFWIDDPYAGQKKTPFLHKLFMTHPPIEERIAALRGMKV